ncbi:MAG: hypothetical protein MJK04_12515 [Psychrosphaera sp.]|nr:hypothetical protein [Psychrosphaera sp.]
MNDLNDLNHDKDKDDWLIQGLAKDDLVDGDLPDDNFSAPVMKRIVISNRVQSVLVVCVPAFVVSLLFLLIPGRWARDWAANVSELLGRLSINSNLMDSVKITGQSFGPSEVIGILLVVAFFAVTSLLEGKK